MFGPDENASTLDRMLTLKICSKKLKIRCSPKRGKNIKDKIFIHAINTRFKY